MRRVKTVIHARRQPQRHVPGVSMCIDHIAITHEIIQCVGAVLDLIERGLGDRAACPDDRVARAYDNLRIVLDGPCTVLEFADKAIVQASEMRFLRFTEIQIRKETPYSYGEVPDHRVLDLAEPA